MITMEGRAQVQAALDALVQAGAPAATVEIRRGEEQWSGAAGLSTLGGTRPANAADRTRIGSITKSMVSAVVLQLVGEGRVGLDDPVAATLPGLLPRPVTVRQLLGHTSGLPNFLTALVPADAAGIAEAATRSYTDDQLLAVALAQPWVDDPGARFDYSNTNYLVLGTMVEHITGRRIGDELHGRIVEPAGMSATSYPDGPDMAAPALSGYLIGDGAPVDLTRFEPSLFGAAGAVVSTVGDVNRFFRALFDGTLLRPEQVTELLRVPDYGYGLGLLVGPDLCATETGQKLYGQRGNGFGYRAWSLSSPDGQRQVTLAWTGGSPDPATDPLMGAPSGAAMYAGLMATCP